MDDTQHNDTQPKELLCDTQHKRQSAWTTLGITMCCYYNESHDGYSHILFNIMLNVDMLSVFVLMSVLNVFVLNVFVLNVIMLSVVMLSVKVPVKLDIFQTFQAKRKLS